MITSVLISVLLLGLFIVGWMLFWMRKMVRTMADLQKMQLRDSQLTQDYKDLTQQVDEIHQTMGGVVNGLKAVGKQVYNLNLLAGHALQDTQPGDENEEASQSPQIMIEIRTTKNPGERSEMAMISPEEMSPEMFERFKIFQAVYMAILSKGNLPSRERPDLN